MKVTVDGKNLVSHAGTALLSELADRSGLTEAMSGAMAECGINWHTHEPGVVLTHLAVAIADGADCRADMTSLREQDELFGPVASIATAWRRRRRRRRRRRLLPPSSGPSPTQWLPPEQRCGPPLRPGTRWCWTSTPRCRTLDRRSKTLLPPTRRASGSSLSGCEVMGLCSNPSWPADLGKCGSKV